MKQTTLLLAAALLTCSAFAQKKETITLEGNGKVTTREVSVADFETLKASGIYELKLAQGAKESVRIEADENLQEYIEVRNEGKQLVIDMPKLKNQGVNLKGKHTLRVYVTFNKLSEMELKMVGNVSSDKTLAFSELSLKNKSVGNVDLDMTANKLDLQNQSVGNMTLKGSAREALVRNKGVGSFKAAGFVVQTMDIENSGVGDADVHAEKDLKVKDNNLGKVQNKGKAQMRRMNRVRV